MQRKRTRPAALLRRGVALALVCATAGLLWIAGGGGEAEGGDVPLWDRLVLAQFALLRANPLSELTPAAESEPPAEEKAGEEAVEAPPEGSSAPLTTAAPDSIVGRTMVPGASSRYVSLDGIYIYNYTDYELSLEELLAAVPAMALAQEEGPQVLIYHSHATEAYTMDGADVYEESDDHRTTDPEYNMVRIGAEMAQVFRAAGLSVIHDDTLYDYPVYSGAYDRSAAGVAAILEEYPTIRLVLDVHRDALVGSDGTVYKTVAASEPDCAQIMLVVGSDAGGQSHGGWRRNLSLAVGVQGALLEQYGTLARPIVLRSSRFNQHMSPGALLVEVGSHGNTLAEAIAAARLLAQTLAESLG